MELCYTIASKSIEAFQSTSFHVKALQLVSMFLITSFPDLNIKSVKNVVKTHYQKFYTKLFQHPNPLFANQHTARQLSDTYLINPLAVLKDIGVMIF
jgi:hypothetical protein